MNHSKDDRDQHEPLEALLEQIANRPTISQHLVDDIIDDDPILGEQLVAAKKTLDLLQRVRQFDSGNVRSTAFGQDGLTEDTRVSDSAEHGMEEDDGVIAYQDTGETALEAGEVKRLGRFEIERILGEGGFGVVYLARDPRLNRNVALKVPRPEAIMTSEMRKRFVQEAEAAAALNHPNIVPVFESGNAGPVAYLAAQFCDGPTLEEWLTTNQRPDSDQAAQLIMALADAVQHAHSRHVFHRDLKPQNIMLDVGKEMESAKIANQLPTVARITDFGLAKIQSTDSELTRTGAVIGTPAYIAPESAAGDVSKYPSAVDVYALGAILYRVLTGKPPFKESTPLKTLQAVQEKEPTSIRSQYAEVDRDLEAICLKCLEKNPANRYAGPAALRDDLARFLGGEIVRARHIGQLQRCCRWCQRNPLLATGTCVIAMIVTISLVVTTALWRNSEFHRKASEKNRDVAIKETDQTREAIFRLFTKVSEHPELKAKGMAGVRRALLQEANRFYDEFLTDVPEDPDQIGNYLNTLYMLSKINSELGDQKQAIKYIEIARQCLRDSPARPAKEVQWQALLQGFHARLQMEIGNSKTGIREFTSAIEQMRQAIEEDPANDLLRVELARLLGFYAGRIAEFDIDQSQQHLNEALDIWEALGYLPPNRSAYELQIASCFLIRAGSYEMRMQLQQMKENAITARGILEQLIQNHPDMPDLNDKLAETYRLEGLYHSRKHEFEKAESQYQTAMAYYQKLIDVHHDIPRYQRNLASLRYSTSFIQYQLKKYPSAERTLLENINALGKLADRFPDLKRGFLQSRAFSLQLLYGVYQKQNKAAEMEKAIGDSIQQFRDLLDTTPGNKFNMIALGNSLKMHAGICNRAKRFDESLPLLDEAIEVLESVIADDPKIPDARRHLASALLGKAIAANGLEQWEDSIAAGEMARPYDEHGRIAPQIDLVNVSSYTRLDRYDEAITAAKRLTKLQNAQSLFDAAEKVAESASLAENGNGILETSQRIAIVDRYTGLVLNLLKQARKDSSIDASELKKMVIGSAQLEPFRKRAEFQLFLQQLE